VCRIADPILRLEQLKLPKQAKTSSKQGAGRLVSREREETLTLVLCTFAFQLGCGHDDDDESALGALFSFCALPWFAPASKHRGKRQGWLAVV
jgi:hypothetical protein